MKYFPWRSFFITEFLLFGFSFICTGLNLQGVLTGVALNFFMVGSWWIAEKL